MTPSWWHYDTIRKTSEPSHAGSWAFNWFGGMNQIRMKLLCQFRLIFWLLFTKWLRCWSLNIEVPCSTFIRSSPNFSPNLEATHYNRISAPGNNEKITLAISVSPLPSPPLPWTTTLPLACGSRTSPGSCSHFWWSGYWLPFPQAPKEITSLHKNYIGWDRKHSRDYTLSMSRDFT